MSSKDLTPSNHFISLAKATAMNKLYRENRPMILNPTVSIDVLPLCETFDRAAFDALLATPTCQGIRLYYSMDSAEKIVIVAVGVNGNNEDILPPLTDENVGRGGAPIVDNGARCPDDCPPPSPLNEDPIPQ